MLDPTDQSPGYDGDLCVETNSEVCCGSIDKFAHFPRHWDDIPQQNVHSPEQFHFSEQFVANQLQSEYWWSRSESACESDCLKSCWLKHTSTEDDRYELTEYQVVREIIWALMGAQRSFVFQYASNPKGLIGNLVCAARVDVKHLTPPTLDSFLTRFSTTCTHANILRLLIHHVSESFGFHPSITMFSSKIRNFLSSFESFLCELEKTAREGPEYLTLILLYTRISTWSSRLHIMADLVLQSTMGRLSSLIDKHSFVRVLDVIYTFASTVDYCTHDIWIIHYLHSLFFHCFYPILSSVVHLLSGSLNLVHINRLFANVEFEKLPADPHSWFCLGIELSKYTTDSSLFPKILKGKLFDLVAGVRSLGIIFSLATTGTKVSLVEPVRHSIAKVMHQLGISISHVVDGAHINSMPFNFNDVTLSSFRQGGFGFIKDYLWASLTRADSSSPSDIYINCEHTITSFQRILHEVIVYRCGVLNQYLMKLLITPTGYTVLDSSHLGSALSMVFSVYLFGASDKMCDFLHRLFLRKLDGDVCSNDLWGMTLSLRSSFERLTEGFQRGKSDYELYLAHIQRFSFRFTESTNDNNHKRSHRQENIPGLGPAFLAFDTEWPIDCIMDNRALATYRSAFNFIVQIKYVKWSLETLPFKTLESLYTADPVTHHRLLLMRINMLYVFTSLHDFLSHRIESLRVQFSRRWHLPEYPIVSSQSTGTSHPSFPGDLSSLVRSHAQFLDELTSLCLLTEDGSMLRSELINLCDMVLTVRSLWLDAHSADQRQSHFQTDLARVSNDFANHIKFLATLMSRVRQGGASRLLPLAETLSIASSFTFSH